MNANEMSHLLDTGWGALDGVTVLDFTQMLAGPYCTQVLADLGATVIKVEAPRKGDVSRYSGPYHPSDKERRQAGYFHSINRNKKSLTIDLKSPEGRQLVLDMVPKVDVVAENFRVGTLEKLDLSYETLSAINPRLVYACIRGFGDPRTGESPYVNWPAYDVVAQAMGGISGVTGTAGGPPMKVGPGVGDTVPGLFMAIGILSALVNRATTGKGRFVDVAMLDSILSLSERIVYQRSFGGEIPGPVGNHQPMMAPFGYYPAKDGAVAIAATFQHFWEPMCKALDAPELLADERFNEAGRKANRDLVIEELGKVTSRFTKAELKERLGGKVPFGPVYDIADIAADPHFAARRMLPTLDIPGLSEPVEVAGTPIKMTGVKGEVFEPAPELGADNDEILSALGYSAEDIARLRAAGAIL